MIAQNIHEHIVIVDVSHDLLELLDDREAPGRVGIEGVLEKFEGIAQPLGGDPHVV